MRWMRIMKKNFLFLLIILNAIYIVTQIYIFIKTNNIKFLYIPWICKYAVLIFSSSYIVVSHLNDSINIFFCENVKNIE